MWTPSKNSDRNNSFFSETGTSILPPSSYTEYLSDYDSLSDDFLAILFPSNDSEWIENGTVTMPIPTNKELCSGSKDEQLDNITESGMVVPQLGGGDDSGITTTNTNPIVKKKTSRRQKRSTAHDQIGIEDLKLQYGKTRAEAAESLGVSVSTLKRICREHKILSWPLKKKKGDLSAKIIEELALSQITNPVFAMQPEPETEIQPIPAELSTVIAKVQYGKDVIKFEISSASKLAELQDEISKRLRLMDGSFNIKYVDEDEDLVLITNDDDVALCMKSLKTANVKMRVSPCSD